MLRKPTAASSWTLAPHALAIKATIARPYVQGDPRDSDSHGGQQYAPLMDIDIP